MKNIFALFLIVGLGAGSYFYINQLPAPTQKAVDIIRVADPMLAKKVAGINFLKEAIIGPYKHLYFKMDKLTNWEAAADYLCQKEELSVATDQYSKTSTKHHESLCQIGKWQSFEYSKNPLQSFRVVHFDFVTNTVIIAYVKF